MTIPYTIPHPYTQEAVQVPQEIVLYCDDFTVDAARDDLRYVDCVWMHLGYYGTPKHIMKEVRNEHFRSPRPIFE